MLLNVGPSLYIMISTRYMPYIWIASIFFLGPNLLAWSYTLYVTFYWVLVRRTSEPQLTRPLLLPMHDVVGDGISQNRPLDRLYQEQREPLLLSVIPNSNVPHKHPRSRLDVADEGDGELMGGNVLCESSAAAHRREAARLGHANEVIPNNTAGLSPPNYGTSDHSRTKLNFSPQMQAWEASIGRFLVSAVSIILLDLVALIHAGFTVGVSHREFFSRFSDRSL